MTKHLILPMLLVLTLATQAAAPRLSADSKISIITCAPGQEELYSAFGHSAIRVNDPELGIDYVYNYGVFDFNRPNFYLNFARGYLYYQLGVYEFKDFLNAYVRMNRTVAEQLLRLNLAQRQKLFDYLEWNALPENQTYRYDYFYNNCATKVRDVVREVFQDSVRFDGSHITTKYTIRELTDLYLKQQPWGDLGIDICLGLPMDKVASPDEYMFLPDYLHSGFEHAFIKTATGEQPLAYIPRTFYRTVFMDEETSWFHPWTVFGAVLLLTILLSWRDYRRKKITAFFDGLLLLVTGLLGMLLLLLWTATDHQAAANNFNLLWALPLNILGLYWLIRRNKHWTLRYFQFALGLTSLLLLSWVMLPQQLNLFLLPLVFALWLRYGINVLIRRKSA